MNLKDAFRYQSFLDRSLSAGCTSISDRSHAYEITKKHFKSKANPDAEDIEECVDNGEYFHNDDVIRFIVSLIDERAALTQAIGNAKRSIEFDIDAAVESNKFRQRVALSIENMLKFQGKTTTGKETDFKFNVDGNQMMYYYNVESTFAEAYDRDSAKAIMKSIITQADTISSDIDYAMINTVVEYTPKYNVNDSFEDMMESFLER